MIVVLPVLDVFLHFSVTILLTIIYLQELVRVVEDFCNSEKEKTYKDGK